jgi:formate hydrogenlyase subunit 3/multisubunit Na+/H+ antiporter MnhD subunit
LIGIVSYLLINFWFTRIQANKAAILALTMNRVGDMGLSIGYFALFALFGSLDYATIFSIVPFMNETAITIIGLLLLTGAMAKSAQIPLHSWLPGSMEGFKGVKHYILIIICILSFYLTDWSDVKCLSLVSIIHSIPKFTLNIITGNMLGDGSLSLSK